MIEVKIIDSAHKADVNIPNQPFALFGRMIPGYMDGRWSYSTELSDTTGEMCFPDENYDYDEMKKDCVFIGAYEGGQCIGLAIMKQGFFKYMYLYDLKVNREYRRKSVGKQLIEKAKSVAVQQGYRGVYTVGQDNNAGACLFYVKNGFRIGGLDTEVYNGTSQEGKADILFYLDC